MALRNHYNFAEGITFVEIVVSIGLFGMLFAAAAPIGLGFMYSHMLTAERDTVISIVSIARARAMAEVQDINQSVFWNGQYYLLLSGDDISDESKFIHRIAGQVAVEKVFSAPLITFEKGSGRAAPSTITLSVHGRSEQILINAEGGMN